MIGGPEPGPKTEESGARPHPASVRAVAAGLVVAHAVLLSAGVRGNSVTYDESIHLPAGLSYWNYGEFWCYHHNPPLVRWLVALPSALTGMRGDDRAFVEDPPSRWPDEEFARSFQRLNPDRYVSAFVAGRSLVAALSIVGAIITFRWASELFGAVGGVVSLGFYVVCPHLLAHGGLATTDQGAAVLALGAGWSFWRALTAPSVARALICGTLLGLAVSAKFSDLVLIPAWGLVLAGVALLRPTCPRELVRATGLVSLALAVSLVVVNNVYLWDGTGERLDRFAFQSRAMAGRPPGGLTRAGGNRFRGTALGAIRVPLPRHFVLGLDAQWHDVEGPFYWKYLNGEARTGWEEGWRSYHVQALLMKTPLGTLGALALAAALATCRRYRSGGLAESAVLALPLTLLAVSTTQTRLNAHVRYLLPALPFLYVAIGRLGRLASDLPRVGTTLVVGAWAATALSLGMIVPDYLAYFNEAAGGTGAGHRRLADSNVDWGQGLVALRRWLDEEGAGRPVELAYRGTMHPAAYGIDFLLPPLDGPAGAEEGVPACRESRVLRVISAHFLTGLPGEVVGPDGLPRAVPAGLFAHYRDRRPLAVVGHCLFIYEDHEDTRESPGPLPGHRSRRPPSGASGGAQSLRPRV